jgi:hypothetical protein
MVINSDQLTENELVLKTRDIVKKLLEEGSLLLEQAGQRIDQWSQVSFTVIQHFT